MKKICLLLMVSFLCLFSTQAHAKKTKAPDKTAATQPRYLRFLRYQELMSLSQEKQLEYMRGVQQIFIDLAKTNSKFSMHPALQNENSLLDSFDQIFEKYPQFAALLSQTINQAQAQAQPQANVEVVSGQQINIATAEEIQAAGANGQPNMHYNEMIDVLHGTSPNCRPVNVRQNNTTRSVRTERAQITYRGVRRYMCVLFLTSGQQCPENYRALNTDSEDGTIGCAMKTTRSTALRRMTATDTDPRRATGTRATDPATPPRESRATPPPDAAPAPAVAQAVTPASPPAAAPTAVTPAPAPAAAAPAPAPQPATAGSPGGAAGGIDGPARRGQRDRRNPPATTATTVAPAPAPAAPTAAAPPSATAPAEAPAATPAQPSSFNDQSEFTAQPRNTSVSSFPPNCSQETYACEFGDTAREASREAFEQDLAARNNSCINGANLSRYNTNTRTCARVSNKTYGDRRFTCSGSQTLCNPLVFGVQENGQALCVRLRANVTLACSTAARSLGGNDPAANALKFLRENPSMQQAWNEWAQSIERMCQPGTDRNSHRFHCTECTLIFTHLQKLNALTGYANACGNLLSSLGEGDPMIVNGVVDKSLPGVLQRNPQPAAAPAQGTN